MMLDLPRSNRRVRFLVAALVAAFIVMTALAVSRYQSIERRLDYSISENVLWRQPRPKSNCTIFSRP